jgi:hypothetical protein
MAGQPRDLGQVSEAGSDGNLTHQITDIIIFAENTEHVLSVNDLIGGWQAGAGSVVG